MVMDKEKPKRFILTHDGQDMHCFDIDKGKSLGTAHRKDWMLLDETSVLDTCEPPKSIKRYELHLVEPYL